MTIHLEMGLGLGHSLTELPTAFSIHPRLELSNKKHLNNQVDIFYMDLSERLNY